MNSENNIIQIVKRLPSEAKISPLKMAGPKVSSLHMWTSFIVYSSDMKLKPICLSLRRNTGHEK